MAKQAYVYDDMMATPVHQPGVHVRINNLRQVEEGLFELSGVQQRQIEWELVRKGFGFEGDMPDSLVDDLAHAVLRSDVMEFLIANMK